MSKIVFDLFAINVVGESSVELLFQLLPIVCLAFVTFLCLKLKRGPLQKSDQAIFVIGITGIASWLQYFPMPSFGHTWWAATPLFGLFALAIQMATKEMGLRYKTPWLWKTLFFGLIGLLIFPGIYRKWNVFLNRISWSSVRIEGNNPLRGIYTTSEKAKLISVAEEQIFEHISSRSTRPQIVNLDNNGFWTTFIPNAQSFHRYWGIAYTPVFEALYPDLLDQLNRYIVRTTPSIIITERNLSWFLTKYPKYQVVAHIASDLIILKPQ